MSNRHLGLFSLSRQPGTHLVLPFSGQSKPNRSRSPLQLSLSSFTGRQGGGASAAHAAGRSASHPVNRLPRMRPTELNNSRLPSSMWSSSSNVTRIPLLPLTQAEPQPPDRLCRLWLPWHERQGTTLPSPPTPSSAPRVAASVPPPTPRCLASQPLKP